MQQHSAMMVGAPDPADRPLKEIVSGLGKDMGLLIRQELELAKAELSENTTRLGKGAVTIGIGAFVAYAGILAFASTLVLLLVALGVTGWVAAAVVTIVLLIIGNALIHGGRRKLASGKPTLQKTTDNAKETVHRLKERLQ